MVTDGSETAEKRAYLTVLCGTGESSAGEGYVEWCVKVSGEYASGPSAIVLFHVPTLHYLLTLPLHSPLLCP